MPSQPAQTLWISRQGRPSRALSPSATKHPLAGGCGGLSTSKARRSGRRTCAAHRRRRGLPPAAWSSLRRPPLPADPQRLRGLRGHRRSPPRTGSARRRASLQSTTLVQSAEDTGWVGKRTAKSPQKSQPEALRLAALVRQQVIEHHRLALPNRDQRRVGRRLRRPFRAVHALLSPMRCVQ